METIALKNPKELSVPVFCFRTGAAASDAGSRFFYPALGLGVATPFEIPECSRFLWGRRRRLVTLSGRRRKVHCFRTRP